jgi:hypothetical protein
MREALMRLPAAAEQTRAQRKREKAWWTLAGPDEGISEQFDLTLAAELQGQASPTDEERDS